MTDRLDLRLSDLARTVEAQRTEIAELRADLAALAKEVCRVKEAIPEFRVEQVEPQWGSLAFPKLGEAITRKWGARNPGIPYPQEGVDE